MDGLTQRFLNSPIVARARKIKQLMEQEARQARKQLEHSRSGETCNAKQQGHSLDEELQYLHEQCHEWDPLHVWNDGEQGEEFKDYI